MRERIWQSVSALSSSQSLLLPRPHSSGKAWDPDLTSGHGCTTTTALLPRLQLDELVWLATLSGHISGGNTDRRSPHPLAAPSRFCAASPCPRDRRHNRLWGCNHESHQRTAEPPQNAGFKTGSVPCPCHSMVCQYDTHRGHRGRKLACSCQPMARLVGVIPSFLRGNYGCKTRLRPQQGNRAQGRSGLKLMSSSPGRPPGPGHPRVPAAASFGAGKSRRAEGSSCHGAALFPSHTPQSRSTWGSGHN